jgi:hypothetical protein
MREEEGVAKVTELMETLDEVKKYNELARSIKKFAVIVLGSVVALLGMRAIFAAVRLSSMLGRFNFFLVSGSLLLIPLLGIIGGFFSCRDLAELDNKKKCNAHTE